jgi:hypothetical protein
VKIKNLRLEKLFVTQETSSPFMEPKGLITVLTIDRLEETKIPSVCFTIKLLMLQSRVAGNPLILTRSSGSILLAKLLASSHLEDKV